MKRMNRREFLKVSLVAGGAAALSACAPAATPEPEEAPTTAPEAVATEVPELDLPFEIAADAINPLNMPEPVIAEGVFFSGGFGHDH